MYIVTAGASALAGNVVSGLFGGGGGGSGGGNAPPVYQPKDQAGRDQNFLDMQNNYQQLLRQQYDQASPYNTQMFQSQMNDPYAGGYQTAANNAGNQYQTNANYLNEANKAAWIHADQSNAWGNQVGAQMQNATPFVQDAAHQMYTMGGDSNQTYKGLMGLQQGQQGNVLGASGQMYNAAGALQQSAFDPQGAMYRQNLGDLVANTRAAEYARGIQMSPAGASVEADAIGRFQNDWQNQQLARQVQGVGAMGQANQTAGGLVNNYANNVAGLQTGMNSNFSNLMTNAEGMLSNWEQAQANINAMNARTNATNIATASSAGDAAAQAALNAGQVPYQANQNMYNNQNTALNNYQNNYQPYYAGMNQMMSNDLGYMNYGQGAQNQAYSQNMQNQQWQNQIAQQFGSSGAAQGAWDWMQGLWNNSNQVNAGQTFNPSLSGGVDGSPYLF